MSDIPFGFGVPSEEPEDGGADDSKKPGNSGDGSQGPANPFGFGGGNPFGAGGENPFAAMFGSLNPNDLGAAFQQLGQMLSYEGGPVNWEMAKDIARQTVAQAASGDVKDPSVGPADRAKVEEALRLADLWLDGVTSMPSGAARQWRGAARSGSRRRCRCGRNSSTRSPNASATPWAMCSPRRCRPW